MKRISKEEEYRITKTKDIVKALDDDCEPELPLLLMLKKNGKNTHKSIGAQNDGKQFSMICFLCCLQKETSS